MQKTWRLKQSIITPSFRIEAGTESVPHPDNEVSGGSVYIFYDKAKKEYYTALESKMKELSDWFEEVQQPRFTDSDMESFAYDLITEWSRIHSYSLAAPNSMYVKNQLTSWKKDNGHE